MITIRLERYEKHSMITLIESVGKKHIGALTFGRRTHKSESEGVYKTFVTENKTYGDRAVMELFNYYKNKELQKL